MMKAMNWKSILGWWDKMFPREEKKQAVNNEEKPVQSTKRLKNFLNKRFDFRYNRLTGVTEYREKEAVGKPFRPIDEREMNGMIVDARLEGIACWNSMVPTLVLSNKVESFNPFHLYMSELPDWDGKDRVTPLLRRVSDDEMWLRGGRYWLRAMASQWMGKERCHANALMPILISGERDHLTKEEERELQLRNKRFYRQSLLEDVFFACFRAPEDEEEGRWFTAAQMFQVMTKCNPSALRGLTAKQFSHRLQGLGLKHKHTNHGNYYQVVLQDAALQPFERQAV
ncbi:MAG: DUF3874 domain-containing protein [Bacteroides sp.]|nr:DUF3874 domain-containing protein [Bacteroides sp.]